MSITTVSSFPRAWRPSGNSKDQRGKSGDIDGGDSGDKSHDSGAPYHSER